MRACRHWSPALLRWCPGRRGAAHGHEHTYGCRHGRGRSRHQAQFQAFADANGGTREASTAGYTASADYVAAQMEGAGYEVTRQPFEYNYFEELAPATLAGTSAAFPFTYEPGDNISTMDYSGSEPSRASSRRWTSSPPVGQPDGTSNSGCEEADFDEFTGDIALIQRGTCDFSVKIANAVAAGADAVIIFNEGNTEERLGIEFGQASFPQDVPVLEMSARTERRWSSSFAVSALRHAPSVWKERDDRLRGPSVRERDRPDHVRRTDRVVALEPTSTA